MDIQLEDINLWGQYVENNKKQKFEVLQKGELTIDNRTMKFTYKYFGEKPEDGYALVFGFHGGGGCPQAVNDSQYENHKKLYDKCLPSGLIWFTPHSCENQWDMWLKVYMEDFLQYFIDAFVINGLVNINKVFITGYSAGGDGIYHMAPRMADHLAGAAMMAGHPNKINIVNLRNIAFSIQVGQKDNAYNRHHEGIKYIRMLNQLSENYGGFSHKSFVHKEMGHWLNLKDAQIFEWLFSHKRDPYPQNIVYKQCPRRKKQLFYYIYIEDPQQNDQVTLVAKRGNKFKIFSNKKVMIRVNSKMININEEIEVIHNGKLSIKRKMVTSQQIIKKTFEERHDPYFIFEDQFPSEPEGDIELNLEICSHLGITPQQKLAQYEQSLSFEFSQTPQNFNKSTEARIKSHKKEIQIEATKKSQQKEQKNEFDA